MTLPSSRSPALLLLASWCAALTLVTGVCAFAHAGDRSAPLRSSATLVARADEPAKAEPASTEPAPTEPEPASPSPSKPYAPVPHGKAPAPSGPVIPDDMPIVFDTYAAQVGDVPDDGPVTYAFKFTNTSDKVVEVELISYCHHCSKPEITPPIVRPGQSGAVIVDIETRGKVGEVQATVSVGTTNRPGKVIPLVASANVVPVVRFDPPRLGMPEVRIGAAAEARGKLVLRGSTIEVKELRCTNTQFVAALDDPKVINDGGHERTEYTLTLQLLPGASAGRHSGELYVLTSHSPQPTALPFFADVMPSFKVDPLDVGRGSVSPGADIKRGFSVLATDAGTVSIESIALAYSRKSANFSADRPFEGIGDLHLTTSRQAEGHKVRVDMSFRAPMGFGEYQVDAKFQGPAGPGDVLVVPIIFSVTP